MEVAEEEGGEEEQKKREEEKFLLPNLIFASLLPSPPSFAKGDGEGKLGRTKGPLRRGQSSRSRGNPLLFCSWLSEWADTAPTPLSLSVRPKRVFILSAVHVLLSLCQFFIQRIERQEMTTAAAAASTRRRIEAVSSGE
jgi:hypothetical protein